jgi:hypothetical protein
VRRAGPWRLPGARARELPLCSAARRAHGGQARAVARRSGQAVCQSGMPNVRTHSGRQIVG